MKLSSFNNYNLNGSYNSLVNYNSSNETEDKSQQEILKNLKQYSNDLAVVYTPSSESNTNVYAYNKASVAANGVSKNPNSGITISDIESNKKYLQLDPNTKNSQAVKSVQDKLKSLGYSIGDDAYGTYDKGTKAAVMKFQSDNNINNKFICDGNLGYNTWMAMKNVNADDYKNYGKPFSSKQ